MKLVLLTKCLVLKRIHPLKNEQKMLHSPIFTTNPIESINATLKRWTGFKPCDMCTFLDEMKDCIDEQHANVKKAFLNLESPYIV